MTAPCGLMLVRLMMRPPYRLVGRVEEREALDRAIAVVEDGHAGALSIVGAPGIGKSRLLAELAERADARGHLVLAGSASELERDLPFGVFVDAIDDYLESLDPRRLERLEKEVRVELARVFPSLAGPRAESAEEAPLQDERYRTHRAVRILLETLATKPLIVVLDDFHWTDSGSIELVGALLRRPPAARVLMVLGYRPRQLPDRLRDELGRAQRNGTLTRIDLEPLSLDDARELLGASVPPSMEVALYEESGGVPFYLEQLARVSSGSERRPAAQSGSGTLGAAGVPPMVVAALTEELALLSEGAREVCVEPRWPATRSSQSLRRRPLGYPSRWRSTRSTNCCAWTSYARRMCHGGFAFGTRSCVRRSMRPHRAAGG